MSFLPIDANTEHLSTAERTQPELVFSNFFENYSLDNAREELRKALSAVIEKHIYLKLGRRHIEDTEFFFEKVDRLIEAAWLLR